MSRQITLLPVEINENKIETLGNIFDTNFDFAKIPDTVCLAGVSFENRQELILKLEVNEKMELVRDPKNIYDKYAIKVFDSNNNHIGWIPKEIAEILAPEMDAGINWKATMEKVTGTEEQTKGVVVKLYYSNNYINSKTQER